MSGAVAITRIINACVLLELGGVAVLTDPYFESHWFMRFREPIGLSAAELPRLGAILGGHGVFDHWQPASLTAYRFKASTPVFVATEGMARKARKAGFEAVEVLAWGERRDLGGGVAVEVAPAQRVTGMRVNSYVLSSARARVFVGTEARDLEPLARYRAQAAAVDVALLPIDGARLLGHRLVMDGAAALEAARILGARTLVPTHYAQLPLPLLMQTPFSADDMREAAAAAPDVDVVLLAPGERWIAPA